MAPAYLITDFEIPLFEEEHEDLKKRLSHRRKPTSFDAMGWDYGMNPTWAENLLDDWGDFDWYEAREALNHYPHKHIRIQGKNLHFIRFKGDSEKRPILLLHGWPSSFVEMLPIAERLNGEGYEVIVPSLPGFVFSDDTDAQGLHATYAADIIHELMVNALGYETYLAHGGDFGANISNRLAVYYPEHVRAIHVMATLEAPYGQTLSAEEQDYKTLCSDWDETHAGYMHIQRTQMQTLAYGLADSPAGMGIWVAEKFWSWCEFERDLEEVVARKDLLTLLSLYWFTNCINSSNRWYSDSRRLDHRLGANPVVTVPTRMFLTTEPVDKCPEVIARRVYEKLDYGLADMGGHFLAWEKPDILGRDLLKFMAEYA